MDLIQIYESLNLDYGSLNASQKRLGRLYSMCQSVIDDRFIAK